jgi:hypothetical protein
MTTVSRLVPVIAVAAVLAAIVTGLIVSGSPQRQRELRFDERRVAELRQLSNALGRFYRETGRLPDALDALVDGRNLNQLPRDPASDEVYDYAKSATAAFKLCAVFTHESDESIDDFWQHAPGRQCFDFDYSAMRIN